MCNLSPLFMIEYLPDTNYIFCKWYVLQMNIFSTIKPYFNLLYGPVDCYEFFLFFFLQLKNYFWVVELDLSSIFYLQLFWIFSSQNISQCTGLTCMCCHLRQCQSNIWFVENISYFNNFLLSSINISLIVLKLSSSHTCTCAYSCLLFMSRQTMDDGHFSGTDFPQ